MSTSLPCTQFTVDYSIIQPDFDRHGEPHQFALMSQESIYTADLCDPDTMNLDGAMYQYSREYFNKSI